MEELDDRIYSLVDYCKDAVDDMKIKIKNLEEYIEELKGLLP